MKQKLYGNHVQPCCEHCANGKRATDGRAVLCTKKGVVPLYHHCRRFVYDPLKRVPHRHSVKNDFLPEEFEIDIPEAVPDKTAL